jgi:exosortase
MKRNLYFFGCLILVLAIFHSLLTQLAELSFHNELYSHFLLIPVISLFFLWLNRQTIFEDVSYTFKAGVPIVLVGIFISGVGKSDYFKLNQNDYLSLMMFAMLTWVIGFFLLFFGSKAFRKALFPLLFLVFIIPIPTAILDPLIRILQVGSAHVTYVIFKIIGIPVFREGIVFELPGITIEVAKECSGIRSSLALIITSVIAGYLFLQAGWKRIVLVLSIFPLMIIKNAVRISTLSLLAVYVDESWLTDSFLHRSGGMFFFLLALTLLAPVLLFLKKSEKNPGSNREERFSETDTRLTSRRL